MLATGARVGDRPAQVVAPLHARGLCAAQVTADERGDSIGDNIIEGCGAATKKDFARFLDNSIKSANETEGHLLKSRDLDLISLHEWQKHATETIEVRKMIYGYCGKVRASAEEEEKCSDK